MPSPHIEVEIRGRLTKKDFPVLIKRLRALGFRHVSSTRRTSVMAFGEVHAKGQGWNKHRKQDIDIRCRVTNGEAEVVGKIGRTDTHNRVEIPINISLDDVYRFARLFGAMGFFTKVGSKHTENFQRESVIVSLVTSPSGISYVELEKMSDRKHEKQALEELRTLASELGITLMKSRKEFLVLCERLTKQDDWEFYGSDKDVKRLKQEIRRMKSDRE